jgi:hypothetical protein
MAATINATFNAIIAIGIITNLLTNPIKNPTLSTNGSIIFQILSIIFEIKLNILSRSAYFFSSYLALRASSFLANGFIAENTEPIFLNGATIPFPILPMPFFIPEPIDFIPLIAKPTPPTIPAEIAPTLATVAAIPIIAFEPINFVTEPIPAAILPIVAPNDNIPD